MMKNSLINKTVIIIFVTIIFYVFILTFSDSSELFDKVIQINFGFLPAIIALQVLQTFISAVKYHRLLLKSDIKIPFKQSFKLFNVGKFMGVTPGGAGVLIKSHLLKKHYGKSISSTFPNLLVERWTEILAVLVLMSILVIQIDVYESKIILLIGYSLFFLSLAIIYNKKMYFGVRSICNKIKFLKKYVESLEKSRESLSRVNTKKNFSEAFGYSLIGKLFQLLIVYLCFLSVGIDLDIVTSGVVYYTSLMAGILTLIPAGMIVTESGMIGLLLKLNIGLTMATLGVLYVRIITLWAGMIAGIITYRFMLKEKIN